MTDTQTANNATLGSNNSTKDVDPAKLNEECNSTDKLNEADKAAYLNPCEESVPSQPTTNDHPSPKAKCDADDRTTNNFLQIEAVKIRNLPTVVQVKDESSMERQGFHFKRATLATTKKSVTYKAFGMTSCPVICRVYLLDLSSPRTRENLLKNSTRIMRFVGGKVGENVDPPHIAFIRTYEIFQLDSKVYVFLDEMNSRSLLDRIKTRKRFNQIEIRNWMKVICDAVQFIQQRGISHRALKIDHILFTRDNQPKICGWGRSVFFWQPDSNDILCQNRENKSIENNHLPPEAFQGSYNPAGADIWSVGVMLCAIHTRRFVFNVKSSTDFMIQWRNFKANHKIDPVILDFLEEIFKENVEDRTTASQMLNHKFFDPNDAQIQSQTSALKQNEQLRQKNMLDKENIESDYSRAVFGPIRKNRQKSVVSDLIDSGSEIRLTASCIQPVKTESNLDQSFPPEEQAGEEVPIVKVV